MDKTKFYIWYQNNIFPRIIRVARVLEIQPDDGSGKSRKEQMDHLEKLLLD